MPTRVVASIFDLATVRTAMEPKLPRLAGAVDTIGCRPGDDGAYWKPRREGRPKIGVRSCAEIVMEGMADDYKRWTVK